LSDVISFVCYVRSFGHHQAKQYKVNGGFLTDEGSKQDIKTGLCLTRLSVTKVSIICDLSLVVVEENLLASLCS